MDTAEVEKYLKQQSS